MLVYTYQQLVIHIFGSQAILSQLLQSQLWMDKLFTSANHKALCLHLQVITYDENVIDSKSFVSRRFHAHWFDSC